MSQFNQRAFWKFSVFAKQVHYELHYEVHYEVRENFLRQRTHLSASNASSAFYVASKTFNFSHWLSSTPDAND